MKKHILLFRVFDIAVKVHWSWLIMALIITSSLATSFFPSMLPGYSQSYYWVLGFSGSLGIFVSILIHEFCHAIVGRKFKMDVHEITIFLFGGIAHLESEPPSPKSEFWMAIVGPLASFVLAIVFYGVHFWGQLLNLSQTLIVASWYLMFVNLVVAVFNMVPGYPLDGGRVLRSALWAFKKDMLWATKVASRVGQVFGWVVIGIGLLSLINGGFGSGFWYIFLGLLLTNMARASYFDLVIRKALHGHPASFFMVPQTLQVRPDTKVSELVMRSLPGQTLFPVTIGDQVLGHVELADLKVIPESEWTIKTAEEVMRKENSQFEVAPDEDAEETFRRMTRSGLTELLVVANSRLLGIISQSGLLRYVSLKQAL